MPSSSPALSLCVMKPVFEQVLSIFQIYKALQMVYFPLSYTVYFYVLPLDHTICHFSSYVNSEVIFSLVSTFDFYKVLELGIFQISGLLADFGFYLKKLPLYCLLGKKAAACEFTLHFVI